MVVAVVVGHRRCDHPSGPAAGRQQVLDHELLRVGAAVVMVGVVGGLLMVEHLVEEAVGVGRGVDGCRETEI